MAASHGKHGNDYDIYRMDLGTSLAERLTQGNGYAGALKLFPDGKTAAFLKWREDRHGATVDTDVYLLDLPTRKLTPFKVSNLN